MIFGLIFGTFLTLMLVPVLYLLMAQLKERIYGKRSEKAVRAVLHEDTEVVLN
jgi:hypothetical protein